MGYLSSTSKTESESKTAPLSAAGMEWDSLFQGIIMTELEDYGRYDLTPTEKTEYRDPSKAKQFSGQIETIQKQIDEINKDLEINPAINRPSESAGRGVGGGVDPRVRRKDDLQKQMFKAQDELNKLPSVTYTDYDIKKKEDPRVLAAIEKYGEGSNEVAQARSSMKEEELFRANSMADIEKYTLTNLKKLTSGDYSYTPEQKADVDKYFGPMTDIINRTADKLLVQAEDTDFNLRSELSNISAEIDKSGFAIEDALRAAELQIEQSGRTLKEVLTEVNSSQEAKAKFQFDLLAQEADQKAAAQAALLGLPPGSQSEKAQALKIKSDALRSIELGLAADARDRELGIAAQTESDKKSISLARVSLAETQGSKKEAVAQAGFNLAELLGGKKEQIFAAQGDSLLNLEGNKTNTLMNMATGQLPQMIAAGQGAQGFAQAFQQGGINTSLGLLQPISKSLDVEQQRTFAEAKNTQQTTSTPSTFSAIGAGLGMAQSLAKTGASIFSGGLLGG